MKIAYVSQSIVPSRAANTVHVLKMCKAFTQEGNKTTLYALRGTGFCEDTVWRDYDISDRFVLKAWRRARLLKMWDFTWRCIWDLRRHAYDMIYCRNLWVAPLAAARGLPTILELHATPESLGALTAKGVSKVFRSPAFCRLVVITQALKCEILAKHCQEISEHQILVAPDGVDEDIFKTFPSTEVARNLLGIPSDAFIATYVGHLYPGRGVDLILQIAGHLPSMLFLIVGGNEDDVQRYRSEVNSKNLANVRLIGHVPHSHVPTYLAAADVLLMPHESRVTVHGGGGDISKWTSPMKMFEYMAAGRLIIASELPVLKEILTSENATFCPAGDPGAWLCTLIRASRDLAWREALASQAGRDARNFTWRKRASKVLQGVQVRQGLRPR